MAREYRWDPCVAHRGPEVDRFIAEYFVLPDRRIVLIAGAGFDPRSTAVATLLATSGAAVRALFIQENRPNPAQDLLDRSSRNSSALLAAIADREFMPVEIFGADGAVTGGRNVITILGRQDFDGVTDVVIDISALSVGTSFPIIRYFVERVERRRGPPTSTSSLRMIQSSTRTSAPSRAMPRATSTASRAGPPLMVRPPPRSCGYLNLPLAGAAPSGGSMTSSLLTTPVPYCPFRPAILGSGMPWPRNTSSSSRALGQSTPATSSMPTRATRWTFTGRSFDSTIVVNRYSQGLAGPFSSSPHSAAR